MQPEHPFWQEVLTDQRPLLVLYPGPHAVDLQDVELPPLPANGELCSALRSLTKALAECLHACRLP